MIEKIAKDVLDKRNVTPCRDFDGLVGIQTHLSKMESLLDLDFDGVKVVAISGPAGIGKTTIARALQSQLSDRFQLTCFVDNLRGSCRSGFDDYGSKLRLQEEFLSKVLNHNGLRISHLGAVRENLGDQKVLIILDDVNNLNQLEALADETTWFGTGSRIVVTTENKELLQQHGIDSTYHVSFPSREEGVEMLCRYAFKQSYPRYGFKELSQRVTCLCGQLPLALRVVGSSLRGKKEDEWEDVVKRLESILEREIEDVLRVGYEVLNENEQTLFLHIAVFFNNEDGDLVKNMFADNDLDVKRGLKILVYRSLVEISTHGKRVVMHKLLRQMARQVIRQQEPLKRQILMDTHEICDVLEDETGTRAVSGISFDITGINEVCIGKKAFKRMPNLRFLKVYKRTYNGKNDIMHIPAEMEFPRGLRLLHWDAYPSKCLPPTFRPENLVELCIRNSQLKYLWQGNQKLTNLKKMDLSRCFHLEELPDLSTATNLEKLKLSQCESLEEIPSSFSHLQKLKKLHLNDCINLKFIPPHLKLASLEHIVMEECSKLRNFSFVSTNFRQYISCAEMEDVPALIRLWPRLEFLTKWKCGNLKGLTYLPTSVISLDLSYSDIERIPDCIKALHRLIDLYLTGCKRLVSLPELPCSLRHLNAEDCQSLETVSPWFAHSPRTSLDFANCIKLGQHARLEIIKCSLFRHGCAFLPGSEVPAKFDYRARGNSLTIPLDGNSSLSALSKVKLCVVMSPTHQCGERCEPRHCLFSCPIGKGDSKPKYLGVVSKIQAQHLYIFDYKSKPSEVSGEKIVLQFSCCKLNMNFVVCGCVDITECGAYIWTEETIEESYHPELDQVSEPSKASEDHFQLLLETKSINGHRTNGLSCEPKEKENLDGEEQTDCWSWLFHCFHLSH